MTIVEIEKTRAEQEGQAQRLREARETWKREAASFVNQVAQWIRVRPGWSVTPVEITITEDAPEETYSLPRLMIVSPDGELILEPVGNNVWGADGRIDLSAYPDLSRVMLLYKRSSGWIVRTDSGINWPNPWNEETFFALAHGLSTDA